MRGLPEGGDVHMISKQGKESMRKKNKKNSINKDSEARERGAFRGEGGGAQQ